MSMILAQQSFGQKVAAMLALTQGSSYSTGISNSILIGFALAILGMAIWSVWLIMHVPKFSHFIDQLRKGKLARFFSLSFLCSIVGAWLFLLLLRTVVLQRGIALLDVPLIGYIVQHRTVVLTQIMRYITILGEIWFVVPAALLVAFILERRSRFWQASYMLVSTVLGAGICDLIFKLVVARPRPPLHWSDAPVIGFAFPSGHATLTVFYIILAYILTRTLSKKWARIAVWSGAMILVLAVGLSRVYLGVHWPTDVLGGWALALFWSGLVVTIMPIAKIQSIAPRAEVTVPLPTLSTSSVTPLQGLKSEDVAMRIADGKVNRFQRRTSRTIWQILATHVFTRFNALLGTLVVMTIAVGQYRDALFGIVIVLNMAIGIIQELRSKWTLDRLSLLTKSQVIVIRDNQKMLLPVEQIVVDDLLEVQMGNQVPVDGVMMSGMSCEVDESQLTGESEPVQKNIGDKLYSGSVVVAGSALVQAIQVGENSYANQLAKTARVFSLVHSELREGTDKILQFITWLLVFMVPLLFVSQIMYAGTGLREAVIGAIAGVVGMIPEGLVLLTSVVMATAVLRLAKKSALIQELAAVEMLARIDTLCVDKTGTLTEGTMSVETLVPVADISFAPEQLQAVLRTFAESDNHHNASMAAIAHHCQSVTPLSWPITSTIAFSSSRKWSALSFAGHGSWVLGAPDIVVRESGSAYPDQITDYINNGKRVLVLAHLSRELLKPEDSLSATQPMLYIVLNEQLRSQVVETLAYFKEQGITIKVISGDHAQAVSAIAKSVGIVSSEKAVDATTLPLDPVDIAAIANQNAVFGRVTPVQKQQLIKGLQSQGHVVAMIGDGVNDVLALKTADFGVAMGAGSDATRAIAQLVLLKNDFGILPDVIAEGRRVISNMERTANLFLTKTTYAFLFALAVEFAHVPFPFLPRHLTIVSFFTIGVPALMLSFAKNNLRAQPGFVARVVRFSLPLGAILAGMTLLVYALMRQLAPIDLMMARTAATIVLVGCGFSVIGLLERQASLMQKLILAFLIVLFVTGVALPSMQHFFALRLFSWQGGLIVFTILVASVVIIRKVGEKLIGRIPR